MKQKFCFDPHQRPCEGFRQFLRQLPGQDPFSSRAFGHCDAGDSSPQQFTRFSPNPIRIRVTGHCRGVRRNTDRSSICSVAVFT